MPFKLWLRPPRAEATQWHPQKKGTGPAQAETKRGTVGIWLVHAMHRGPSTLRLATRKTEIRVGCDRTAAPRGGRGRAARLCAGVWKRTRQILELTKEVRALAGPAGNV